MICKSYCSAIMQRREDLHCISAYSPTTGFGSEDSLTQNAKDSDKLRQKLTTYFGKMSIYPVLINNGTGKLYIKLLHQ